MTIKDIQDYMISNYGFESDFTLEIFNMIELGVSPSGLWGYIKMSEVVNDDEFEFEYYLKLFLDNSLTLKH